MHIAFWSPAWPLEKHQNGIITYVHSMKEELEKRGHQVSVFTGKEHAGNGALGADYSFGERLKRRVVRRYSVFDFSSAIATAILREHRRHPIDVIEMEESFGWCAEVQRRTDIPMVVKLHGPAFLTMQEERDTPFGREKIEREGRSLRRCSAIVSPSEANMKRTLEYYGLKDKMMRVIPNPVTTKEDAPLWDLRTCDPTTVLFVGRFDRLKGADIILRAFPSVLTNFPQAKLVFVGPDNGLMSDNGSRLQFDSYCESLLPPQVRERIYFRGRLAHEKVAQLRTTAMVTIVASRWESQPYTILEAMGQGCPVVSTDAGACPESVLHQKTGLLARSEDPEDFASKICEVLADPQKSAQMGLAAREHVIKHHSPGMIAEAMISYYRQTISRGTAPTPRISAPSRESP